MPGEIDPLANFSYQGGELKRKVNPYGSQREKMLAKASTLFWEKGYSATSMRDIARAYGCKAANIYNFFPNKEALLYEFLSSQMKLIISQIEHLEQDRSLSAVEQLRFLMSRHLEHTLSYSKNSRFLFDVGLDWLSPAKRKKIISLRDDYDRILRKVIERGMQSGEFVKMDAKITAFNISSMIVRSIIWFSPKGKLSVEEILDHIFGFVLKGLKREEPARQAAA
jgi:TetR/AcrR family transcriptional regulator, cholesterol catabolism regulator